MKRILPHLSKSSAIWISSLVIVVIAGLSVSLWLLQQNQQLRQQALDQQTQNQQATGNIHQIQLQNITLQEQVTQVQAKLDALQEPASEDSTTQLKTILQQYQTVQQKVDRNALVSLDTATFTDRFSSWGLLLLDQDFKALEEQISSTLSDLDKQFQDFQASTIKTAPSQPSQSSNNSSNPAGYISQTVSTARGNFDVKMIKLPLSQYTVKTVSATDTTCTSNCPAKHLAQYVSENGAYAGINGTYFCPPDYSSCNGKTNSFDFAFFNSNSGQWLNPGARSWTSTGMITFSGSSAQAHKVSANYSGYGLTAAISNFPPLILYNGQINSDEDNQTVPQTSRNYKGALGINDSEIFLVTATGVSITDLATVMKTIGATHALNLDGGGSGALYINGAYKVGPGRALPNAIVLIKK